MIQVVDLFSCVGAHRLGWELAEQIKSPRPSPESRHLTFVPEHVTLLHCESRPFRRRVLEARWPETPVYTDVRNLHETLVHGHYVSLTAPVAVVGGPPCQNTSPMSNISGSKTNESLVEYQVRIAAGLEAEWCVVEQPTDTPVWEERAVASLTRAGYFVGRLEFSASDFGAPYQRRRVYLLACSERGRLEVAVDAASGALSAVQTQTPLQGAGRGWDVDYLGGIRVDVERSSRVDEATGRVVVKRDRGSDRQDRIEALGDSNPPEMMAVVALCLMEATR